MFKLVRVRSHAAWTVGGKVYDSLCVGRGKQNELSSDDRLISGTHARFVVRDASLHVIDLDSRNGTEVNGARLVPFEPWRLERGDVVDIAGRLVFRVQVDDSAQYPVITVESSEDTPESTGGGDILRILALPDGLTPALDASRLLRLQKLTLRMLDPVSQRGTVATTAESSPSNEPWLQTFVEKGARVLKVDSLQVLRHTEGSYQRLDAAESEPRARADALAECVTRKRGVALEISRLSEYAEDAYSTFDSTRVGPLFIPVLCGAVMAGDDVWGVLYATMGKTGGRQKFDELDVWFMERLCELLGRMLVWTSLSKVVSDHAPRYVKIAHAATTFGLVGQSAATTATVERLADAAPHTAPLYVMTSPTIDPTPWLGFAHAMSAAPTATLHRRPAGALTGASLQSALGAAVGGWLVLEEIEELTGEGQTALLAALSEHWTRRLKLVVTSRFSPAVAVERGLQANLGRLLGSEVVRLPSLDERLEDLDVLVLQAARALEPSVDEHFDDKALAYLAAAEYPGGTSQLEEVVRTALASSRLRPLPSSAVTGLVAPRLSLASVSRGQPRGGDREAFSTGSVSPDAPLHPLARALAAADMLERF